MQSCSGLRVADVIAVTCSSHKLIKSSSALVLMYAWLSILSRCLQADCVQLVPRQPPSATLQSPSSIHRPLSNGRRTIKIPLPIEQELTPVSILNRFPLLNRTRGNYAPIPITTDMPAFGGDGLTTGMWAVKLRFSQKDESRELLDLSANMIAQRHGLENHGQIGELRGYYLFTRRGSPKMWTTMASAVVASATSAGNPTDYSFLEGTEAPVTSRQKDGTTVSRSSVNDKTKLVEKWNNTRHLLLNTQVEWQGHQVLLTRSKRGFIPHLGVTDPTSKESQVTKNAATSKSLQNATAPKLRVSPSSAPSSETLEEKARHEFYLNFANQYSRVATVTHQRTDVTQNPRYRELVGASGGGGRRMGVGLEEDVDDEEAAGDDWVGTIYGRANAATFSDPLYYHQWHLENTADAKGTGDCNVTGVWKHGITGEGIVVAVVDDGVQWDHPDLFNNYCPEGSFDLNANDDDPMPVRDDKEENKHGTRCAGEIAAVPNDHCGVGIAYGARFSGIRILDGPLTDSMEAAAFNKHLDVNDIYSCSWGPEDDGKTVDGPHPLAQAALQHGIVAGRQGYGSIYIVASGNGGHKGDNCNYDGYANSIYTITIGAVDEFGRVPSYAEECASMLASTFSSGAGTEDGNARKIVTTDWTLGRNKKRMSGCTESHTGTSAATPLAAGMVALMLEARPCLTWRDIQHIMVMTSTRIGSDSEEWTTNTAGFHHSDKKGFGLLNAWRLVNAARVWRPVPWLTSVSYECPERRRVIPSTKKRALIVKTLVTKEQCEQNMVYSLEQVLVTVDIDHPRRGDLFISLVCPSGTTSIIGRPRKNDDSSDGLWNWSFTTVKCWGEQPHGTYRMIIHDTVDRKRAFMGELRSWKLLLYGSTLTQEDIDLQRNWVEESMSGKYLETFIQLKNEAVAQEEQTSNNSVFGESIVGYCPELRKKSYTQILMLEKSPTERTLKLVALSGCFLLFWGIYCLLDTAKLRNTATGNVASNKFEGLETVATKLYASSLPKKGATTVNLSSAPRDDG